MIPRTRISAIAAVLLLVSCREAKPVQPPNKAKPELYLITSLPIAFGEQFGLDLQGSPVMKALEQDYRVRLVDLPSELPKGALLLAAQPRALPAEDLVKLDDWVREGGRMVLLADPMLEWPSDLPLGDRRRAPIAFADTGLLEHWGLRLDAPEQRGPVQSTIGGMPVLTSSPGQLVGSGCRIADDGLRANCSIGNGRAIVIADADLLNAGSDKGGDRNLPALESQLASLTR